MLDDLKSLPKGPEELRAISELLMAEVKSQSYKIEKLKSELAGHRKARFESKFESMDQRAPDLADDAEMRRRLKLRSRNCLQTRKPSLKALNGAKRCYHRTRPAAARCAKSERM